MYKGGGAKRLVRSTDVMVTTREDRRQKGSEGEINKGSQDEGRMDDPALPSPEEGIKGPSVGVSVGGHIIHTHTTTHTGLSPRWDHDT